MAVAKSYQNLEILCDPYSENGKLYVKVKTADGNSKRVRWYSDAEYKRMYAEAKVFNLENQKNQKDYLGFKNGYITIFKGDTYHYLSWFRATPCCKYNKIWGWYIPSDEELLEEVPEDLTAIKLSWDVVSENNVLIENENTLERIVDELKYDDTGSQYIGKIKERLDLTLTVTRTLILDGYYGYSTMHTFEDESGNIFIWTTAAKTLKEGETYHIRGTIKEHKIYRNQKQNVLTRCAVIEEG